MELIRVKSTMEETVGITNSLPFIEANTIECTITELEHQHIIPVFNKDNIPAISQLDFIRTAFLAVQNVFGNETINSPIIRVSHPIKGRIPEARNKPVHLLKDDEKTLYYERMAFIIEIPSLREDLNGNTLNLTIGGVKAYNLDNLNTRFGAQHFKFFIGFKNKVCTNLCISTDGLQSECYAMDLEDLYKKMIELFLEFDVIKELKLFKALPDIYLKENELAQMLGKARLYNYLPSSYKKQIPPITLSDTQWNAVARGLYSDENFKSDDQNGIDGWKLYNLLTGANKSSYIDSFIDRGANCTSFIKIIHNAKRLNKPVWYLN